MAETGAARSGCRESGNHMAEPVRHVIVVLGMHRSGTSAITRALSVMGVDLGSHLLPPVEGQNDKGFWEDADVMALDDEVLGQLGETWDSLSASVTDRLGTQDLGPWRQRGRDLLGEKTANCEWFGMKDPRIVRLLPFWQAVFADLDLDVRYVLALRHPLSVAASLARRNGFVTGKSLFLWLHHVIPAVRETAGRCRTLLDYDRLMAAPALELRRVAGDLGLADRLDESALGEFCDEFLEDGLCHSRFGLEDLMRSPEVSDLVRAVYQILERVSRGELGLDCAEVGETFDAFAHELRLQQPALDIAAALDKENAVLRQRLHEREVALARLRDQAAAQAGQLEVAQQARDLAVMEQEQALASRQVALARAAAIETSTIWRFSAPLRQALTWLRRVGRSGDAG